MVAKIGSRIFDVCGKKVKRRRRNWRQENASGLSSPDSSWFYFEWFALFCSII